MSLLSNKENNPLLQKIHQKYKDYDVKIIILGTHDLPPYPGGFCLVTLHLHSVVF
jgi:hypothetical protein